MAADQAPAPSRSGNSEPHRPATVAFDVIETLFSTEPIEPELHALGLPDKSLPLWFARLLRDAFALEASGEYKPFKDIGLGALKALCAEHDVAPTPDQLESVLSAFASLPAHPDAEPAFEAARKAGFRIVTLTNGSAKTTREMIKGAGLSQFVDHYFSIEEVKHWKPAREVYLHAVEKLGVSAGKVALVAAHAWDVDGAAKAGLVTGAVIRPGKSFTPAMRAADVSGASLLEVVRKLAALPR